ncbi:hypothetical protein ACQPW3_11630 [Actinosynnema sp. CA-248983]
MSTTELHAQAGVWEHGKTRFAVLYLEGEAPCRAGGEDMRADALFRTGLLRGLTLTTDLDHLSLLPTRGWRAGIDGVGAVTLVADSRPAFSWSSVWRTRRPRTAGGRRHLRRSLDSTGAMPRTDDVVPP